MVCISKLPCSTPWILLIWFLRSSMEVAAWTPPRYPPPYPIVRQVPRWPSTPQPDSTNTNLTVLTTSGLMKGTINSTTPNVSAFLSIPYAQPPVGELRWKSPQPLTDAMKVDRDVSRYGPSCQQFADVRQAGLFGIPAMFAVAQEPADGNSGPNRGGEGTFDEDCLTLSVHTPSQVSHSNPLPVLIFITGGGMVTGGINVPVQDPSEMVQRSQSHIVVAMNYRLGIFGFPAAAGISNLTENNLGILDQRMAIEWARDNVAAFGGDPTRMVLWGQSAGGFSVGVHDFAYADDPIVSGLIADSGNVLNVGVAELDTRNFTYVADMLCDPSEEIRTPDEELACLRQVPGNIIQKYINERTSKVGGGAEVGFGPSIDGKVVYSSAVYEVLSKRGSGSNIPLIIGSNTDEVTVFQPSSTLAMNRTIIDALTASQYTCTSSKIANQRSSSGNANRPVFVYQYAGNFSDVSPDAFQGAYHGAELPMLFGTTVCFGGNGTTSQQNKTMSVMQDLWFKFARDGAKGLEDAGWPSYKNRTAVVFGKDDVPMQLESGSILEKGCTPAELA